MIKFLLVAAVAFGGSKKQEVSNLGPFKEGARPAANLVQCTSYPDLGKPQNPKFKPQNYPWPKISGIGQNQMGPYACAMKLPMAGIVVGGGKYGWPVSDSPAKVSKERLTQATEMRRNLSSGQKFALLMLEAANPNWTRALSENGIRMERIDFNVGCLMDRVVYVTSDLKYYYKNYYRYLGIVPEDADFIPELQKRDYKNPADLKMEMQKVEGCLE